MSQSDRSRSFYQSQAETYFRSTAWIDPSGFLTPLAKHLEPGSRVLDVGCGSGRDLRWLKARGFRVRGLEGAPALAALAREHCGCEVLASDFLEHDFTREESEALLLIGALVHLDRPGAAEALKRMLPALVSPGLVLVSLKEGRGLQRSEDGRLFRLWSRPAAEAMFRALGLELLEADRRRSSLRPEDVWLGFLLQRRGAV